VEPIPKDEDELLRSVSLQNAASILAARRRAEDELIRAKEALERRTTELMHSLSMVRATLEATTDGILVTDESGMVNDCNEQFVSLWRVPPEILSTRDHAQLKRFMAAQFRDPDQFESRIDAIQTSASQQTLDVLELADGRVFERASKLQFVDERRVGRVWSFREITERRRAEEEHGYLAAIVASSNDAIISKTLTGIIMSWNAAAEKMLGYTGAEAIGQSISIIIPPERFEEERGILERLARGERVERYETLRMRKGGDRLNVSLTISPVRDGSGRIMGASTIIRDISERERLLALEQAARAQAEEASRLKDDFLATVSHELRTPLNAILGWAHILRASPLDDRKVRHAAEVVERNARAQAQLIEDLLDVSRIISGKLRLDVRPLMPSSSVESALESVKPMAEAKGVHLHAVLDSQAGPVSGDSGRLQQIAWNLLSNAIKFTPKGGRVEVRLERINSHVEIVVTDTGDGISPDFLPHVFDRFRQSDATASRATSGLGLGLAIVRHLVELHGGMVRAESMGQGRGSTFTVRLPLRPIHAKRGTLLKLEAREEDLSSMEGAVLRDVRVLIVDDESDAREVLREVLERCGAHVRDTGSAQAAFELVKEWRPEVIVSDIGMPGEDGYTLIRTVREWEKGAGTWIPAVALTAYARSEDRVRALLAGYQVHIAKPIEPVEFALVVAGIVQHGQADAQG
jgi:PAS domain S-box-containing protein